ncbi:MAG: hypothetical protein GY757_52700 [bacterium]|nr:hypothetical protein [bacterium]
MSINEKKTKSTVFMLTASIVCLLVIGYFLLVQDSTTPSQVTRMQEMTQQVNSMEAGVKQKKNDVIKLVDLYRKKSGQTAVNVNFMDLNPKEKELLKEHIAAEKDLSVRSLLREILKKNDELTLLNDAIAKIEKMLPAPYIAKKGDSHYQIALNFLVENEGIDEDNAKAILSRTALFEELAEGFKVWNFYTGESYGTSVTQGNASVSPNSFVHRTKRKLMTEHTNAVAQRDKVTRDFIALEAKQDNVVSQLNASTSENQALHSKVNALDKHVNSMFYRLDSMKNLKKENILKSRFLSSTKLKDVSPKLFNQSLDLNSEDQLVISAEEVGVKNIKDITLFPKFHKKETGYKVIITSNKQHALLILKDKDKFKSERIVIAVK